MHRAGRVLRLLRARPEVVPVVGLEVGVAVQARDERVGEARGLHQRLGGVAQHVRRDVPQARALQLGAPDAREPVPSPRDDARGRPDGRLPRVGGTGGVEDGEQARAARDEHRDGARRELRLGLPPEAVVIGVGAVDDHRHRAVDLAGGRVDRGRDRYAVGRDGQRLLLAQAAEAEDEVGLDGGAAQGIEGACALLGRPRPDLLAAAARRRDAARERLGVHQLVVVGRAQDGAQDGLAAVRGAGRLDDGLDVAVGYLADRAVAEGGEHEALHGGVVLPQGRGRARLAPRAGGRAEDAVVILPQGHRAAERGGGPHLRRKADALGLGLLARVNGARDRPLPAVRLPALRDAHAPPSGLGPVYRPGPPASFLWHNGAVPSENSVSWDAAPARRSDSARGPLLFTCLLFERATGR